MGQAEDGCLSGPPRQTEALLAPRPARPPRAPQRPAYTVAVVPSTPDPKAAAAVLRWLAARAKR